MAQTLVWRPWDFQHTDTNLSPVGSDDASPQPESCDISPIAGSCKNSLDSNSQSSPTQATSSSSPDSGSCETTSLTRSGESSPSSSSGVHSSMSGCEHNSPESSSYNKHNLEPQRFSSTASSTVLRSSHFNQIANNDTVSRYIHFNQISGHNTFPRFPLYNPLPVPASTFQHFPLHYRPAILPPFTPSSATIHTTTRPIYQPPTNLYSNVMPPPAAFVPDLSNLHLLQSVACNAQPLNPLTSSTPSNHIPSSTPSNHMPQYTRSIQDDKPLDLTSTCLVKQEINDSKINEVQHQIRDPTNKGHQQYGIHINTSYHQLLKKEIVTDEEATILYDDDMPHVTKSEEEEDDFIIDVVTCNNEDQKIMEHIPDSKIIDNIPEDISEQKIIVDTPDQKIFEDTPDQKINEDLPYQKIIKDTSDEKIFESTHGQKINEHNAIRLTPVYKVPVVTDVKNTISIPDMMTVEHVATNNTHESHDVKNKADEYADYKTIDGLVVQRETQYNTNSVAVVVELHVEARKRKGDDSGNKSSATKKAKKDNSAKREKVMPYGDHELHELKIKFDSSNKERFCDEKGNYIIPKIPEDHELKQELKTALSDLFANSNLPKIPEQLKDNLKILCYFPYMNHLLSLHQDGVDIQTLKFSSNGFSFQNPQLTSLGEKFYHLLDSMYQTDGEGFMHCCVPRAVDDGALCGHVTNERGKMRRHCKVHFPHKKWVCCFCRAQMFDTTDMDRHTALHTGLKPYSCTQCGTQYAQKISLVSHVRRHHS